MRNVADLEDREDDDEGGGVSICAVSKAGGKPDTWRADTIQTCS